MTGFWDETDGSFGRNCAAVHHAFEIQTQADGYNSGRVYLLKAVTRLASPLLQLGH